MIKNVPKELRLDWEEAGRLSDAGDLVSELKLRQKMVGDFPASSKLRACLAHTYQELGDFDSAEAEFREAVNLAPAWGLASRGVFHILWDQDRRNEAMDELARFMSVSYCDDYMEIVREINQKSSN